MEGEIEMEREVKKNRPHPPFCTLLRSPTVDGIFFHLPPYWSGVGGA